MYNNYGYNPYYQPQRFTGVPQQPIMEQPIQQYVQPQIAKTNSLQGKMVDSFEVAKASEVPLDGSISYFVLTDGSCIMTKQLQSDGTSKMVVYKPVEEQKEEKRYITQDDLKNALNGLNLDEIEDIKEDIKEIKKQLKKKGE